MRGYLSPQRLQRKSLAENKAGAPHVSEK